MSDTSLDDSPDDGFTLVELLTVMLIIGILATIALPLFLNTRQNAYSSAMKSDLRNAVTAEDAYLTGHPGYTTDVALLTAEGYRVSQGVTPVHVKLVGESFVACVKHADVAEWLVYDASDGSTGTSASDCAPHA
jgi:prepilin-type N-terminal cleavage/methylation domain-containing protein